MTVSPDARTPSATVHALSGSTPPGAGAVMQPFGIATGTVVEMPDTFVPLGTVAAELVAGLETRRAAAAHPDAEIIDLAERVVALAAREDRAVGLVGTIEDHITFKGPQHPTRDDSMFGVERRVREMALPDLRDMLARELQHDPDPAWVAEVECSIARMEAYEAAVKVMQDRFDLVRIDKRRRRMFSRLVRWAARLTTMEPQTLAGLKAKAEAQIAVEQAGNLDTWTQDLASSLSRDALRLIGAQAEARYREDQQHDGELLALGRAWEQSCKRHERACAEEEALLDRRNLIAPPEALFNRPDETGKLGPYPSMHLATGRYWYGDPRTIDVLRKMAAGGRPDARRDEIIAGYDRWRADVAVEGERSGLTAARAEREAAVDENTALRARICLMPARTRAGIDLKLRAVLWLHDGLAGLEHDMAPKNLECPHFGDALALSITLDLARMWHGNSSAQEPLGGLDGTAQAVASAA